jgi:chromosome segregation ATPase
MEYEDQKSMLDINQISQEVDRFSSLSSEMISLLESFRREINRSASELQDIRESIEGGKRELEALCEIEKETSVLEEKVEDLRRQKESLEAAVADLHRGREEAEANRAREELEYQESLRVRRQREEEEYRLILEGEQKKARQKLEEELEAIRKQSADARAADERAFLKRDSALNKKERELALLMKELEKFLAGLAVRIGAVGKAVPNAETISASDSGEPAPEFVGSPDESKGGFNPGNTLLWEDAGEERSS